MEQPGHTYNPKTLLAVYVSLIALAITMVGLSRLPLEKLPIDWLDLHFLKGVMIFGCGAVMAVILAGFLMGLFYEKTLTNALIFGACFAFLLIFLLFTWADIAFRGKMDPTFTQQINWESPVNKAPAEGAHHPE